MKTRFIRHGERAIESKIAAFGITFHLRLRIPSAAEGMNEKLTCRASNE
jgi:hypothetical protein